MGSDPDWKKMQNAKRYSPEERDAVRSRILELQTGGMNIPEITVHMNKEGYKDPSGNPLKEHHINNQLYALRKKAKNAVKKRREAGNPAPVKKIPTEGFDMVTNPTARLEEKAVECPVMVALILANEELGNDTKIAMIKSYYKL